MKHYFISHSSKDKEIAVNLCSYLESHERTCWISSRDIQAGQAWAPSILNAIETADAMILLLTDESNRSQHIARELQHADKSQIRLIPVKVGQFETSKAVTYFTDDTQCLEWSGRTDDVNLNQLLSVLDTVKVMEPTRRAEEQHFETECPECGGRLTDKGVFCPFCGVRLIDESLKGKAINRTIRGIGKGSIALQRESKVSRNSSDRKTKILTKLIIPVAAIVTIVTILVLFIIPKESREKRILTAYNSMIQATQALDRARVYDMLSSDIRDYYDSLQVALYYYGFTAGLTGRDVFVNDSMPLRLIQLPETVDEVIAIGDSAIVRANNGNNTILVLENNQWKIAYDEYIPYAESQFFAVWGWPIDQLFTYSVGYELEKGEGEYSLRIFNDLPPSDGRGRWLYWVYIRPSGTSLWGTELLGDTDLLNPSHTLTLHIDGGEYDIKMVDQLYNELLFENIVVTDNTILLNATQAHQ